MGGKTAQSTSQVQIPPEILAQYNAVNAQGEKVAAQPFQSYSSNPDAFVAPLTGTQQAGIENTNAAQGLYAPFFNAATQSLQSGQSAANPLQSSAAGNIQAGLGAGQAGAAGALSAASGYNGAAGSLIGQSAGAVNPTALGGAQIGQFMSPFNQSVVQSTLQNLQQQQQQEQSSEQGNQIMRGAFGGDRGQVAQANLARQQDLATAQTVSGLENQNYSQALAAAQQQQGVGLGAGQANRAALASAGQGLGALGQQVYGQQAGTAGQLFSQALGAGQAQAGLGQQLYGQGASTAGQLSGLGSAAQQNALSGAQAQIGAGQVEQQTQQGGLSALYNQFLQGQAYPFQTTQFLGGLAYGQPTPTTTTSTQPTGFLSGLLSDKRAKEDIEPIGETYDGQKIVRFRYKGQPQTQVGLVAQNVERKHPGAVQERSGLKFVDYEKATDKAAKRGHFDSGGAVGPGMYPWGAENGSRVGAGLGPWGISFAQLPHGKVLQSDAPKIKQQGLEDLANEAKGAEDLYDEGKGLVKFGKGLAGHNDNSDIDSKDFDWAAYADGKYRGGLVRHEQRKRYAMGGIPYGAAEDSYVPTPDKDEDKKDHLLKAATSGSGNGPQSGGLMDAAKTAMMIASLFKRGGSVSRHGYADGGGDDGGKLLDFLSYHNKDDAGTAVPSVDADDDGSRGASGSWKPNKGLVPHHIVKAPPMPNAVDVGPVPHQPQGLAPDPQTADVAAPPTADAAPAAAHGATPERIAAAVSEPHTQGWFARNQDWLVPLLKGVGTAASSHSLTPIPAILQGLGAGASSYEDTQKAILERQGKQADIQSRLSDVAGKAYIPDLGAVKVMDGSGNVGIVPQAEFMKNMRAGKQYKLVNTPSGTAMVEGPTYSAPVTPSGTPSPAAAPTSTSTPTPTPTAAAKYAGLSDGDLARADQNAEKLVAQPRWTDTAQYSGQTQMSPFADIRETADAARSMDANIKGLASALSARAAGGRGGEVSEVLDRMASSVNDTARRFLGPNAPQINPGQLAVGEEIKKFTTMLASQAAATGHQNAFAALNKMLDQVPSLLTSPQGAAEIMPDVMIQQQRPKDLDQFATSWRQRVADQTGNPAVANFGGDGLTDQFEKGHQAQYQNEKAALRSMFTDKMKNGETAMEFAIKNAATMSPTARAAFEQRYGKGILRYFNVQDQQP